MRSRSLRWLKACGRKPQLQRKLRPRRPLPPQPQPRNRLLPQRPRSNLRRRCSRPRTECKHPHSPQHHLLAMLLRRRSPLLVTRQSVLCPKHECQADLDVHTDPRARSGHQYAEVARCSLVSDVAITLPERAGYLSDGPPLRVLLEPARSLPVHATGVSCSQPCLVALNAAALPGARERLLCATGMNDAMELARQTGATLRLPAQHRARFTFTPIAEGESIRLGPATLRALATPGHTQESMSYVLNDAAVFTGDTLFTNGVGRPDLHADPDAARHRAHTLFASLTRLQQLPSDLLVLPAHTSEPIAFDGRAVVARLDDVATWLSGWMVSESAFVERLTANLPPTPPNFVRIVELNEAGEFPTGDPTDLEAGANRCAVR